MERSNLSRVRRWAAAAVAANVALLLLIAWALPKELLGVLPVLGLMLPLLSTGFIEAAAETREPTVQRTEPRFTSLRHVTANARA
jgi:hypothetical protein